MHISVNYGHVEGRNFDSVVQELEFEFGYKGHFWEMTVASRDMEILAEFLEEDGLAVELDGEEIY